MNKYELTFGEFEGKTFEWLFFNAPWYPKWMHDENVLRNRWDYDDHERSYFNELFRRANRVAGTCTKCGTRPLSHFDIGDLVDATGKGKVGIYCDQCYDEDAEVNMMIRPSFFSVDRGVPRCSQLTIARAIADLHIGKVNLTQPKMEEFFRTDAFFLNATPGFFKLVEEVAL